MKKVPSSRFQVKEEKGQKNPQWTTDNGLPTKNISLAEAAENAEVRI
jgi:hypothetical protein